MCAQNTVCAKCALKTVSDHTIPIRKWPLIRPKSDHCQTIVQPWPRRNLDHCPDNCALQMSSDHTIPIRKRPLIILSPSGSDLWSYYPHPEATSDHTIPIRMRPLIILFPDRKWPLIRPFPSGSGLWSDHFHPDVTSDQTIPIASDLWSDHSHPEPKPRPCNYGLGTHRVRWTSDDQRSLADGTSNWVEFATLKIKRLSRLVPRLKSRPKFSSDQTFQSEIISHQTFQTLNTSDQTFHTKGLWSDFSDRRCSDLIIFRPLPRP